MRTKNDTANLRLSEKENDFLRERARSFGVSVSELIRKAVFQDFYIYTMGLDDQSMSFISSLSRIRKESLEKTVNFVLHSCERGYKKEFAAAQVNFAPNA